MKQARPIIFGEVLFDCFDDEVTLGGAPFNVAWHLQGLGLHPLFVSRVGGDELGRLVLDAMTKWGMDLRGMQRDPKHPTGRVRVTLENNQPYYEILADQAYDHVDAAAAASALGDDGWSMLYHGTLAARQAGSAEALRVIRERSDAPVFVDVNLRDPWWKTKAVERLVRGAACVKLNGDELRLLAANKGDLLALASDVQSGLRTGALVVTLGEQGALVVAKGVCDQVSASLVGQMVDPVGAGDAFSAATITGILREWPWRVTLERAAALAARVCEHRGAIREDQPLYRETLRSWEESCTDATSV